MHLTRFSILLTLAAGCGGASALPIDSLGGAGGETGGTTPPEPPPATQVSAKWDHVCAVDEGGGLWCWGNNGHGEIGVPGAPDFVPGPLHVDPAHTYRKVAAGVMTTCAIRSDKSLWCWGRNHGGPLATGDRVPRDAPVAIGSEQDWEDVTVGSGLACGLRAGGRLYCWGSPDYGAPAEGPLGADVLKVPTHVPGTWVRLASHWYQTLAIRDDGTLWVSRNDGAFEALQGFEGRAARVSVGPLYALAIDDEGALSRLVFTEEDHVDPIPEAPGATFGRDAASAYTSCVIDDEGRMYCGGDHAVEGTPITATGDGHGDYRTIGVGNAFACASRDDASVWCWGTLASDTNATDVTYGTAPVLVVP